MKAIINILLFASSLMVAFSAHAISPTYTQYTYTETGTGTVGPFSASDFLDACNKGGQATSYSRTYVQALPLRDTARICAWQDENGSLRPTKNISSVHGSSSCPSNSTLNGSSCTCNTGYAESNNQCLIDENDNGIPDDDEPEDCGTDTKTLRMTNENISSTVCLNGCKYEQTPPYEPFQYFTIPSSPNPNQVYVSNQYTGTGESCVPSTEDNPQDNETPPELDCTTVGMVNNATNDGCISPESPACPENYVDTLTEAGCQPMACPVCTFWSSVGGSAGTGGCIQNDACQDPILDNDNDGKPNKDDPDIDGDGVPNTNDPDIDGDGIPNSRDDDIDGDGVPNGSDNDMDGDGQANSVDSDKDGDGVPNEEDEQEGADEDCASGDCGFKGEDLDGKLDDIKEQYSQQIEDIQNDFSTIFTPLVSQSADLPIYSANVKVGRKTFEAEMDTSSGDLAFDRIGVILLMIAGIASVFIVLSGLRGA